MCDISIYRLRIGIFQMPGAKKSTFRKSERSVFKRCNYSLILQILLLFSVFVSNISECHLPQLKSNREQLNMTNPSYFYDVNFYARYTYGNRKSRGIKLCHWNAGNAYLKNKINSIENLIGRYSPHILGISEANLLKCHSLSEVQIPGYELFLSSTMDNDSLQYSRVVVYKHSSIISKVRSDLMSPNFSSIWLQCGMPNKKKFLVRNLYREWQLLGQGEDKSSKDIRQQLDRWVIFLDQFERALTCNMEVYCMGDVNLDFMTWTKSNLLPNHKTVRLRPLFDELFDRIITRGVKQCVVSPTRSWPGQVDSGLDHFYTNAPT